MLKAWSSFCFHIAILQWHYIFRMIVLQGDDLICCKADFNHCTLEYYLQSGIKFPFQKHISVQITLIVHAQHAHFDYAMSSLFKHNADLNKCCTSQIHLT